MDADILLTSDDRIFKLILTSPKAKVGLIKLISAITGRDVIDVTLHPNELDFYLKDWQSQYKRYVHLTQGAKDFLENHDWPGNLDQVNSICQRVVLLTEKRNIDEVFLRRPRHGSSGGIQGRKSG